MLNYLLLKYTAKYRLLTLTVIIHFAELFEQFALFHATLDDGDADQLMRFFINESACTMPPQVPSLGWCSKSNNEYMYIYTKLTVQIRLKSYLQ